MKKLLLLLPLAIIGTGSMAQIFVHDIVPDSTLTATPGFYSLKPVSGGPEVVIRYFPSPVSVTAEQHGGCEILFKDGYPAKLNFNDTIASHSVSWVPGALALSSEGNGNWTSDATDKYLAFRFKNVSGAWHYGWLKMSVVPGGLSCVIQEWAYQTADDKLILAGQKSDPTGIYRPGNAGAVILSVNNRKLSFQGPDRRQKYTLLLTGMDGRCLLNKEITATDITDVSSLPPGVYAVQLLYKEGHYRYKIALP
jgi:hypothetical protein